MVVFKILLLYRRRKIYYSYLKLRIWIVIYNFIVIKFLKEIWFIIRVLQLVKTSNNRNYFPPDQFFQSGNNKLFGRCEYAVLWSNMNFNSLILTATIMDVWTNRYIVNTKTLDFDTAFSQSKFPLIGHV